MKKSVHATLAALGLAAVLSTAALAQNDRDIPAEDQNACQNDAFTYCGDAIPDHDKIATCLRTNWKDISTECRNVMIKYSKTFKSPRKTGNAASD